MQELLDTPLSLTHGTADVASELLLADYGGSGGAIKGASGFYRLSRALAPAPALPFALRLSETGLFADTARHAPAPGILPYKLNAPGCHDGATGEHFIALPAGGAVVLWPNRNGDPPDGTALVQTLTRDGRRLETRVLLKQQNDWAGYSYVWDAAQRDAELADKAGADLNLTTGASWRVPSRAERMMSHTREANFALTLNAAQLNHGAQLGEWEQRGIPKRDAATARRGRRTAGTEESGPGPQLVPVHAKDADLESRARSYLAVNFAHSCTENGGVNSTMRFGWTVPQERMQTVNEIPQHGALGLLDARFVVPGRLDRSVLVPRVTMRGPGQMPPMGTRASDPAGLQLLVEWIQSLRN
jgi:hypothetical protein